jgi:hypothetical protein
MTPPPRSDFMTEEEWDAVLASRKPEVIRANSRQHVTTYLKRGE